MTDNELKKLVASIAIAQKETVEQFKATDKRFEKDKEEYNKRFEKDKEEYNKRFEKDKEEYNKRFEENETLLKELLVFQKEVTEQLKKTDEQLEKTDKMQQKTEKLQQEADKQIIELGRQIGGLGRKFGSFTEGLALPSMQKILQDKFKMEVISPSVRVKKEGKEIEIDVLAYANSTINEVYIVEVKSHLREEGITQLQKMMNNFRYFFPDHRNKKLYGILAAVDMSAELKKRILALGFYTANIREDLFSLNVPDDFKAKVY